MKGVKFTDRCVLSAVCAFLVFLYVLTTFWSPSPTESDFERTMHIMMKSVNLQFQGNELLGPFLERDWVQDMRGGEILADNASSKCESSTELLIGVISHPRDTELREQIRRTWAYKARYNRKKTKVLFFMGRWKGQNSVINESSQYGDVVHIDYDEGYYNLSIKSFALLKYHRDYCNQAKCVLKVDTDVVVNLEGVEELCNSRDESPLITGGDSLQWAAVNRNSSSKYYVPHHIYNAERFPPYAQGPAYMLSGSNISTALIDALSETPFYYSENFRRLPEDVIINGIARSIAEVPLRINSGFSLYKTEVFGFWCPPTTSNHPPTPLIYHGAEPLNDYYERLRRVVLDAHAFSWWQESSICGFFSRTVE